MNGRIPSAAGVSRSRPGGGGGAVRLWRLVRLRLAFEGADVDENLGLFTFELENGTFTLSQDPPKPVEFPVIIGPYESKGDLLVLTPTTFRDQVWTLRPHQKGDTVTFEVVHVNSRFSPEGVKVIFETHAWTAK